MMYQDRAQQILMYKHKHNFPGMWTEIDDDIIDMIEYGECYYDHIDDILYSMDHFSEVIFPEISQPYGVI